MLSKRLGAFIGVAASVLVLSLGGVTSAEAVALPPSTPISAIPTVGVLSVAGYGPVSTGTVINTAKRNTVLIAAHSIDHFFVPLPVATLTFSPGYEPSSGNPAPYGVWRVASYHFMPKRGIADHNPDYDTALLVLEPNSRGQNIQDVVGAQDYRLNAPISGEISSIGYPTAASAGPLYCRVNTTVHKVSGHKDEFQADCGTVFGDGVSGSPFMTNYDARTHKGTVVANVGGDNEGGDATGELTYGVRLDNEFKAFLDGVIGTA